MLFDDFLTHFYSMKKLFEISFWTATSVILILAFGRSAGSYINAFYFVSFFMPVCIAISWFINSYLVPHFLFKKKYAGFFLYLFYTIVISLNILFVLLFVALILISYYEKGSMRTVVTNFRIMPPVLYVLVLLYSLISIIRQYFILMAKQAAIEDPLKQEDRFIVVRSNRINRRVNCNGIEYIESMTDYVRIFMEDGERVITRENISTLDNILGDDFLRIHRSYIVNIKKIISFGKEKIILRNNELPVSRTYKNSVTERLDSLFNNQQSAKQAKH